MTPLPTIGYRFGLAAFGCTVAFAFVQLLQLLGVLTFPLDEILIYATPLGIVVPFVLEMVAFHHLTDRHAASGATGQCSSPCSTPSSSPPTTWCSSPP